MNRYYFWDFYRQFTEFVAPSPSFLRFRYPGDINYTEVLDLSKRDLTFSCVLIYVTDEPKTINF